MRWGDDPGLSEWFQFYHKDPCKREARKVSVREGDVAVEAGVGVTRLLEGGLEPRMQVASGS